MKKHKIKFLRGLAVLVFILGIIALIRGRTRTAANACAVALITWNASIFVKRK